MNLIRVVVADDSPFVCRLLKKIIESTSEIEVIATVQSGEELIKIVTSEKPDVVTLNSYLSDLKVLEVLSLLQEKCPTPTIIISGAVMDDSSFALAAIEMGVVDFIFKFSPGDLIDLNQIRNEIISKIKISAQVDAATAAPETILTQDFDITEGIEIAASEAVIEQENHTSPEVVIVVGASDGGPVVIREFLEAFPENFPGSVIVVHPNITTALADLLGQQPALKVREAVAGERLESGTVYVSSGGSNLYINADGIIDVSPDFSPEENCPHPSIDLTMKSIAKHYKEKARGILLTGIGHDGISGLRDIQSNGGRTYVQDPESCAINGIPQLAIEAGVVDHIAPPSHLARLVTMGY